MDDYAVLDELGYQGLGKAFLPRNGYPDVTGVMYNEDLCISQISENEYPDGRYFVSNEALSSKTAVVRALSERFEIESCVFTVRFPWTHTFSNYRYSGWLSHDLASFLKNPNLGAFKCLSRMRQKVLSVSNCLERKVSAVPIEARTESLEENFFSTCFGRVPESLRNICNRKENLRVNKSIGMAFSCVLADKMSRFFDRQPTGAERAIVVKSAQAFKLPEELEKVITSDFLRIRGQIDDETFADYSRFLTECSVAPSKIREAIDIAKFELDRVFTQRTAKQNELAELSKAAEAVLVSAKEQLST